MAQMADLITGFAERRAGDVASMAASMQTQLRSRQGAMQSAFGELDAHRDAAVAELKVPDAPGSRPVTSDTACIITTFRTCITHCSLAMVGSPRTIRRRSTHSLWGSRLSWQRSC